MECHFDFLSVFCQLIPQTSNVKVNFHNKALGHYREMAWLPFQKRQYIVHTLNI